jgi:ATP-binding cassette subfamily B protein
MDINDAVVRGVPVNQMIAELMAHGWPKDLANKGFAMWLQMHGVQGNKMAAMKMWLKKYHSRALPAVGVVVGLNLFDTAIALLKPWPVKIMADSVFGNKDAWGPLADLEPKQLLMATSIMTISLFVFGALFGIVRDFFLLKIGFRLNRSIKQESLRHILHLPLFHQERLAKGDYVYRQNVVTDSLSDLVLGTTSSIIQSIIVIVGVLGIMLHINPSLSISAILLIPSLFVTIRLIGPHMGKYARMTTELASESSSKITESVNNAEAIQAFTLEDKMVSKIDTLWLKSYNTARKSMFWREILDKSNGFLVVIATSSVMYMGGSRVLDGKLLFGDLIIFITYMGYLVGPVQQLINQVTSRNQKLIDVSRIYEVLTDHEGIEDLRTNEHMPEQIKGNIELKGVTYAYKNQAVFQNLNLTIPSGQKVGIIGPSGGGKSTILKLLPLFIEPAQGSILIDGVDTQQVSLKELRRKIAWVSQTPQLFNEDIFTNLLEGDIFREVTDEELGYAVEVSNISEFVMKMPMAFESPVGEDGGSLSGGQRQRLSIARALIKNAPIICLDEPTAALDVKSENYIRDSLAEMVKGKTVVMVTHRKPLLALMDVIYVLENGVLSDVRSLGGLDAYLAKLEGIEQEAARAEIKAETQTKNPHLIAQFLKAQEEKAAREKQKEAEEKAQIEVKPIEIVNPHPDMLELHSGSSDEPTEISISLHDQDKK